MLFRRRINKIRGKKAVSIMIGYVLLITAAVVMSGIVYAFIKTYVPKDIPECPGDVSLLIKNTRCEEYGLVLELKNNGLFDIWGYFIRATKNATEEVATVNLAKNEQGGFVQFTNLDDGVLKPNQEIEKQFTLLQEIFSIEVIPIRVQTEEGKKKFVTCGKSVAKEKINCGPSTIMIIEPPQESEPIPEPSPSPTP